MDSFNQLQTPVGNMYNSDPDDILQTRRNFKEIGIDAGEEDRPYIDHPLDNAIRVFQRETGLKEDGIMNPGGETENVLNLALAIKDKEESKEKLSTPPLPQRKPKKPPLPGQKPEKIAQAFKIGKEKARMLGELGGGMLEKRIARVPFQSKIFKTIIKKTSKESEGDIAKAIQRLFENRMINAEIEKAKKENEEN
ncbi:MAG: peptidoglycan-binding protein [Alphaproteobacteria bacterium]|nr:peptidoglycan-binding protein [Alphaproteobacteria bacterium]